MGGGGGERGRKGRVERVLCHVVLCCVVVWCGVVCCVVLCCGGVVWCGVGSEMRSRANCDAVELCPERRPRAQRCAQGRHTSITCSGTGRSVSKKRMTSAS